MTQAPISHADPKHSVMSRPDATDRKTVGEGQDSQLPWPRLVAFAVCAAVCFHVAYSNEALSFMILGYLVCLLQLARASSFRKAFYAGLAVGLSIAAGQLLCFWS